jgi:hypothetical protein
MRLVYRKIRYFILNVMYVNVNIVFCNCISSERAGTLKKLRYRYHANKNKKYFFRHITCMCRISGTEFYRIFVEEHDPCGHKSLPFE